MMAVKEELVLGLMSFFMGFFKAAFGIGAGVFLVPIGVLFMPPRALVGAIAPLMLITDLVALRHQWRKWAPLPTRTLLEGGLAGLFLGIYFLAQVPAGYARKAIGVVALTYALYQLAGKAALAKKILATIRTMALPAGGGTSAFFPARSSRTRSGVDESRLPSPWWGRLIGFAAGAVSGFSHTGGVILAIYLSVLALPKEAFVATIVFCLLLFDLVKLTSYWHLGIVTLPILGFGLFLLPAMVLGGALGKTFQGRLSQERFLQLTAHLILLSGLALLLT